MAPEFSVILPTRGRSAYLGQSTGSVLAESEELELLVVHDRRPGEPPLAGAPIDDPRVRVLESSAPGVSNARNRGIDAALGRFVAFIDDDDLWLPGFLRALAAVLDADPNALMAGCDACIAAGTDADGIDPDGVPVDRLPRFAADRPSGPVGVHELLLGNAFLTSAVLLRRESLGQADRFDTSLDYMEDYDLWLRLARRAEPWFDDTVRAVIRKHPGNASRNRRGMAEGSLEVLERHAAHSVLSEEEWRRREGRLWHELAYACLVEDDVAGVRAAASNALRRLPWTPKNYLYLLASALPAPLRRATVGRGAGRSR